MIVLKALSKMSGRCERIRTFDPLHPMQVRYQAAPHTEFQLEIITAGRGGSGSIQRRGGHPNAQNRPLSMCGGQQLADFKEFTAHLQELLDINRNRLIDLAVGKFFELRI